jgi:hypothetical protein
MYLGTSLYNTVFINKHTLLSAHIHTCIQFFSSKYTLSFKEQATTSRIKMGQTRWRLVLSSLTPFQALLREREQVDFLLA